MSVALTCYMFELLHAPCPNGISNRLFIRVGFGDTQYLSYHNSLSVAVSDTALHKSHEGSSFSIATADVLKDVHALASAAARRLLCSASHSSTVAAWVLLHVALFHLLFSALHNVAGFALFTEGLQRLPTCHRSGFLSPTTRDVKLEKRSFGIGRLQEHTTTVSKPYDAPAGCATELLDVSCAYEQWLNIWTLLVDILPNGAHLRSVYNIWCAYYAPPRASVFLCYYLTPANIDSPGTFSLLLTLLLCFRLVELSSR